MKQIDLISTGPKSPAAWRAGAILQPDVSNPAALADLIARELPSSSADAWLFWDGRIPLPPPEPFASLLATSCDVWHAGLSLGMDGKPGAIDFICPNWMFARDPHPESVGTSWRLSLSASLIRTTVLRSLGGPQPRFQSLAAAGLEMGHRYISRGAFLQNVPQLVTTRSTDLGGEIPFEDEIRFILYRFGRFWATWAAVRAGFTGYAPLRQVLGAYRSIADEDRPENPPPFKPNREYARIGDDPKVTVLIPTLGRYGYLRVLLDQLRYQTIPPAEILIIDQTPERERDVSLENDFPELPLRVIRLDTAGQCTSRNAGLQQACGEYVLFIDDDDEVGPTLIEDHLRSLEMHDADVSSGVADEVGAGPLPEQFRLVRTSDVFPTNNTLIRRSVLGRSGLFDLAYDHASRADGDLGMRLYLTGARMVLNPDISVLHHHASRGGLRAHKARVVTYSSSRKRILHRHLPSASEIYLARRYFSPRQTREMLWLRVLGTLQLWGPPWRRAAKILTSLLLMPDTLWRVWRRSKRADKMLERYPQIPKLDGRAGNYTGGKADPKVHERTGAVN